MHRPDDVLQALQIAATDEARLFRLVAARPAFDAAARSAVVVALRRSESATLAACVDAVDALARAKASGALLAGRDLLLLIEEDGAVDAGDDSAIVAGGAGQGGLRALAAAALVLTSRGPVATPGDGGQLFGAPVREIVTTRRANCSAELVVGGERGAERLLAALTTLTAPSAMRVTTEARVLLDVVADLGGLGAALTCRAVLVAATHDVALRRLALPERWRRGLLRDDVAIDSIDAPRNSDVARATLHIDLVADADVHAWLRRAKAALGPAARAAASDPAPTLSVTQTWTRSTSPAHGPFLALLDATLGRTTSNANVVHIAAAAAGHAWGLAGPTRPCYGVFPLQRGDSATDAETQTPLPSVTADAETVALLRAVVEVG